MRRIAMILLAVTMICIMALNSMAYVDASSNLKISKKTVTMHIAQTTTLKVKGTNKKVKWSSSDKSVATVSGGKITAKKEGTATIIAKVGKKKLKCKVKVLSNAWYANESGYPENMIFTTEGVGNVDFLCKSAKYRADGSLWVEMFVINNTVYSKITRLSNIRLTLINEDDKDGKATCLCDYLGFDEVITDIPRGEYSVITFKIAKKHLATKGYAFPEGGSIMSVDSSFDYSYVY